MKTQFGTLLQAARDGRFAVLAINILNHLTLSAVLEAAVRKESPIIIQTSVATVKALKPAPLAAMARAMIDAAPVGAVLHLDHCQSIEMCQLCCDLGWDSVMFDSSHLSFENSIEQTRKVRIYAQSRAVDVEGEVGIIAGTEDDISHDVASLAGFDETIRFIKETGVDAIAPAIGTAHGVYKGEPKINFDLVEQLNQATSCPVVIHGGTGLSDATFRKLIELGAAKINVSTAIKQVYVDAMREYLAENRGTVNPLKLDAFVFDKVVAMTESLIDLFGSANKWGAGSVLETARG
ncbi:MAG: class II fructose-bisphosphate aldolase [Thermoguttaceae bacterium]